MVYREGMTDAVYLESPDDVGQYTKAYDNLRAIASSPPRSVQMIKAMLEEHSR
ncbi:Scr1 family TA system antitoxin-like transcriptional regulator [Streptomyces sp. WAC 00631]|uniref:Scr1 family TA system antitoxin-like transcriptional regulator n=1 Tax=Streptomyces sp. WAC 00631 TaxID=2203201 RepID=UPI00163B635C|nr:Scr1 family TA system antitoxin-like transcriptional regulator [Streptomyces sp. WAC 00631]